MDTFINYSNLTIEQLKYELGKRGQTFTTLKDNLINFIKYIDDRERERATVEQVNIYQGSSVGSTPPISSTNIKKRALSDGNDNHSGCCTTTTTPLKKYNADYDTMVMDRDQMIYSLQMELKNNQDLVHHYEKRYQESVNIVISLKNQIKAQYRILNENNLLVDSLKKPEDNAESIELKLLAQYDYSPILQELIIKCPPLQGVLGIHLVREYNRFITLKIVENDYEGSMLYPSTLIGQIWYHHILNTKKYEEFCKIIGMHLHHNSKSEFDDPQDKRNRYLNTLKLYKKHFTVISNDYIWPHLDWMNLPHHTSTPIQNQQHLNNTVISLSDEESADERNSNSSDTTKYCENVEPETISDSNQQNKTIFLNIINPDSLQTRIAISANESMEKLLNTYCQRNDLPIEKIKIKHNNRFIPIGSSHTPNSLGIKDSDIFALIYWQKLIMSTVDYSKYTIPQLKKILDERGKSIQTKEFIVSYLASLDTQAAAGISDITFPNVPTKEAKKRSLEQVHETDTEKEQSSLISKKLQLDLSEKTREIEILQHELETYRKNILASIKTPQDTVETVEIKLLTGFNYTVILEDLKKLNVTLKEPMGIQLLKEYNRFITMKVIENDVDSEILYPSPLIKMMWSHHVLNTKKYDELSNLIGFKLHYDTHITLDDCEKKKRYQHTLDVYKNHFLHSPNESIWPSSYEATSSLSTPTFNQITSLPMTTTTTTTTATSPPTPSSPSVKTPSKTSNNGLKITLSPMGLVNGGPSKTSPHTTPTRNSKISPLKTHEDDSNLSVLDIGSQKNMDGGFCSDNILFWIESKTKPHRCKVRMSKYQTLDNLINAYTTKHGYKKSPKFVFNQKTITNQQTPKSLGMKDSDIITTSHLYLFEMSFCWKLPKLLLKHILNSLLELYKKESSIDFYKYFVGLFSLISKDVYQILKELQYNVIDVSPIDNKQIEYITYLHNRGFVFNRYNYIKTIRPTMDQQPPLLSILEYQNNSRCTDSKDNLNISKEVVSNFDVYSSLLTDSKTLKLQIGPKTTDSLPLLDFVETVYRLFNLQVRNKGVINDMDITHYSQPVPPSIIDIIPLLMKYQVKSLYWLITDHGKRVQRANPLSNVLDQVYKSSLVSLDMDSSVPFGALEFQLILKWNPLLERLKIFHTGFVGSDLHSIFIEELEQHQSLTDIRIGYDSDINGLFDYLSRNSVVKKLYLTGQMSYYETKEIINNTLESLDIQSVANENILAAWKCPSAITKLKAYTDAKVTMQSLVESNHKNIRSFIYLYYGNEYLDHLCEMLSHLPSLTKLTLRSFQIEGAHSITNFMNIPMNIFSSMTSLSKVKILASSTLDLSLVVTLLNLQHPTIKVFKITTRYNDYEPSFFEAINGNTTVEHIQLSVLRNPTKSNVTDTIHAVLSKPNIKSFQYYLDNLDDLNELIIHMTNTFKLYYNSTTSPIMPDNFQIRPNIDIWKIYYNSINQKQLL
ncbi:hypothetical protein DLAC_01270 [Tieghemostelium lacteum]|uniref:Rad60/SUMO-like domain-containing protein n=1 Tax=Tieghemostelium lacteum TaxID=361077 RepID=A0A152A8L0_TIELA|nr:hypothetical protein DLAC_01270 [Tieghemostelium lacteum]|eukprot:KYR02431.1 hypothetical protein DLAC_01270 [Tieghemostelium lacteum]